MKHGTFDTRICIGNQPPEVGGEVQTQKDCGVQVSAQETLKGARWMPRLATAMKDVISQRNAPGRRLVARDPEVSVWGNPIHIG